MDQKNNDIPASEMTLRDRFALAAIGSHQGLMFESASSRACFARAAYMFADSMLEAREEGHEE